MGIYINWRIYQLSDRQNRAGKAQGELAHSLDPTDHHKGLSSGRNIHTESKPLIGKVQLSDMTVNSGAMEKKR